MSNEHVGSSKDDVQDTQIVDNNNVDTSSQAVTPMQKKALDAGVPFMEYLDNMEQIEEKKILDDDSGEPQNLEDVEKTLSDNDNKEQNDDALKVENVTIEDPDAINSDKQDDSTTQNASDADKTDDNPLLEFLSEIGITSPEQLKEFADDRQAALIKQSMNPLSNGESRFINELDLMNNKDVLSALVAAKDGNKEAALVALSKAWDVELSGIDKDSVEPIKDVEIDTNDSSDDLEVYVQLIDKNTSKPMEYIEKNFLNNITQAEFIETVSNPSLRAGIEKHIETGAIEHINERIELIKSRDYSLDKSFSNLDYMHQYTVAAAQLSEEFNEANKVKESSVANKFKSSNDVVEQSNKKESAKSAVSDEDIAKNLGAVHSGYNNDNQPRQAVGMDNVEYRTKYASSEEYNKWLDSLE